MKPKYLSLLLISVLLLACSNDEGWDNQSTPNPPNDESIHFNVNFQGEGNRGLRVSTDKNFNSTWQTGDQIGLYVVVNGQSLQASGNYADNIKLTRQSDGSWDTDSGVTLYYPNNGDNLDFYAYYPYNTTMSNPASIIFNIQANQSQESDYNQSDLLLANNTNIPKSNNAVQLDFGHAMSMIQVEAKRKASVPQFDNSLTVTLKNALPQYTFNLSGIGTPSTGGTSSDIVMYKITDAGSNYIYRALVPAQTLGANAKIVFEQTTPGQKIKMTSYDIANTTLSSGATQKYEITLGL